MDWLASKFEGVQFQVLTYKEENPGQEWLQGSRLQMVLEDQPKTKWTSQSKMGLHPDFAI